MYVANLQLFHDILQRREPAHNVLWLISKSLDETLLVFLAK